ncbi:hypothetical protein ACH24_01310 [Francisella persica ATCC VR-331]|uniref:Uncharacterized protein n=1 Tax=Francisella persica ATCC VR-331 TaxID=1086726 RepID=A0AAC8VDV7_9GAMM|nr:type VI secretion system baseplate protein IglJ [Francisella persica]ALB01432.1 hypothetical protein ACH24_01310 [Francisella persica ATCC VR-331]ANH77722.1 hypothetical protein FSC845_04120 [Francisella persica ATCC VR-331]
MKYINNINKSISLNNFISFLKNQKYPLEKIKLIPVLIDNVSSYTILDIYEDQETLNVKINVFKIKPFAKLQSMYQEYIQNNNSLAIQVLEYGIKVLLNIYVLDNKMLYKLTQENTYIKSAPKHTIDSIINSLYKLLSEDYCTVINYTEKPVNIRRKQRLIRHSSVGNTFLGGNMPSIIYIINISIFLLRRNESIIEKIKSQIKKIEEKITDSPFKIEFQISIENSRKNCIYLGYFSL